MTEIKIVPLEEKRFVITPESIGVLKDARASLEQLQKGHPYLVGIGFFGSRIRGQERLSSDLDACIFYDANKMSPDKDYRPEFDEIREAISISTGVSLGEHTGWIKDIGDDTTDFSIQDYVKYAKQAIFVGGTEEDITERLGRIPQTQNLYSRFFLGIGKGLYENRAYILDEFSQMSNGDKYFQLLMACLGSFERDNRVQGSDIPAYPRLPQTIAEARDYFLIQPVNSHEILI